MMLLQDEDTQGSSCDVEQRDLEAFGANSGRVALTSIRMAPNDSGGHSPSSWPAVCVGYHGGPQIVMEACPDPRKSCGAPHLGCEAVVSLIMCRTSCFEAETSPSGPSTVLALSSCFDRTPPSAAVPLDRATTAARLQRVSRLHADVVVVWRWCLPTAVGVSQQPSWQLVACTVKDRRSLFGTFWNGVRLVPGISTSIMDSGAFNLGCGVCLDLGGHKGVRICFPGRESIGCFHSGEEPAGGTRQLCSLPSTPMVPPVRNALMADAAIQTDATGVVSGASIIAAAQPQQGRGKRKSAQANRSSKPVAIKARTEAISAESKNVFIIEDEEDSVADRTHCPEFHAAPAASKPRKVDDTNATIHETQMRKHVDKPQRGSTNVVPTNATMDPSAASVPTCTIPNNLPMTIVTTGTRLSADERRMCDALSLTVNPPMQQYHAAQYLVVEPPLIRSVKLLSVIPFVDAVLHRSWLDAAFACGRLGVPVGRHMYSETYTRRGIEASNDFRIDELVAVPPARRQSLFRGWNVYVHVKAQPQDEPHNDMKHVVVSSGGTLCKLLSDADLVILPTISLGLKDRKELNDGQFKEDSIVITVEDLFRAVLQQRRPTVSTVSWVDTTRPQQRGLEPSAKRKRGRTASASPRRAASKK